MTDLSSPLASADPNSLTTLFLANPTTLTPADEARLVKELHRRRDVFASEEAAKAASGKTRAKATHPHSDALPDADKPVNEIDLDGLV